MSDRDALLAAISANPDDDTPRLMFADWLDEHEPDAKPRSRTAKTLSSPSSWAALIRAECEFERLRRDSSAAAAVFNYFLERDDRTLKDVRWEQAMPEMVRLVELHQLIPTLCKASNKVRNARRPKVPGARWDGYTSRGFPYGVSLWGTNTWIRRLPELAQSYQRLRIHFDPHAPLPSVDKIIASGLPRWCRALQFNAKADHADLIEAMSHSPDTTGVRELHCGWAGESHLPRILAALIDSPHWSGLRELVFDDFVNVSLDLQKRLFACPHLRGLTHLKIAHCEEVSDLIASFSNLTELRSLAIRETELNDDDAVQLANMPSLANLRTLDLRFNNIDGRGASALLASPHLKNLAVLDLEENPIHGLDLATLSKASAGGLKVLNLKSGRLTATDIVTITSSPRVSELVYFAACYNLFPESTIAQLVKGFGNRAPAVLYLMATNIKTDGAQVLANWPAAGQIDMLHLSDNQLSVTGAKAIAASPHLQQLNHLCASVANNRARAVLKKQFGKRVEV